MIKWYGNVDLLLNGSYQYKFWQQKSGQVAETGHAIKQEGQLVFAASEGMLAGAPAAT